MENQQTEEVIIFQDIKAKTGKKYDWKGLKLLTNTLSDSYLRIGYDKKAIRSWDCATLLEFQMDIETGDFKLARGHFCQIRLCPMCAKRRALKIFAQVSNIMAVIKPNYKFLFLTLTVKNVTAEQLNDMIKHMSRSFNRLFKYKAFEGIVKGFFRALEITYNEQRDDYHPHYHVILAVPKSYAKHKNGPYLKQEAFTLLWKKALQIDYTPIVHITKFGKKEYKDKEVGKAVAEAAKYTVKSVDYLKPNKHLTDKIVATLDKALEYKRLIGMGGIFKEIHAKLNLDHPTDGDLVQTNDEDAEKFKDHLLLKVKWSIGYNNYVIDNYIAE